MPKFILTFSLMLIIAPSCHLIPWKSINYRADPNQVSGNLEEEFERLILTEKRHRATSLIIKKTYATLRYTRGDSPGEYTLTIPFNEIATIKVQTKFKEFSVEIRDAIDTNREIFRYIATCKQKAIHFANVIAALKERSLR